MSKKLSQLAEANKLSFEALMEVMNNNHKDDIKQRIKVAQKFDLDLTDEDVLQLLLPVNAVGHNLNTLKENVAVHLEPVTKSVSKIYGDNWIVLQNRLLNAISDLDLNERRLIMFLSPLVRKAVDLNPQQRTFTVKVKDFQAEYGINSKAYYGELEKIIINLQQKYYEFWNFGRNEKEKSTVRVNWFSKGQYKHSKGEIHVDLHNDVVEMLTVFDKANPFTKYERQMIVSLGCYGIILFELVASCMHQKFKQKAYTIDYLREKFNCTDIYPEMFNFKRYVLDRAIKDIEKHTPYRIEYEQKKAGRQISEILFKFNHIEHGKPKTIEDQQFANLPLFQGQISSAKDKKFEVGIKVVPLNELQAKKYAGILKSNDELVKFFGSLKDYDAYYQKIYKILRKPDSVSEEAQQIVYKQLYLATDFAAQQ